MSRSLLCLCLSVLSILTLSKAQWNNNPSNNYGSGSNQYGSNSQYGQSSGRFNQDRYGGNSLYGGTGNSLEPFRVVYEWFKLDYAWLDEMTRTQASTNGRYVADNNAISGIKVWRDRLFVTVPRMKTGIPVTLASIPVNGLPNQPPRLEPFPNWQMQEIGNCSALQFVQSVEIDTEGRIWILDIGRTNTLNSAGVGVGVAQTARCPPKLVIIDLNSAQFSTSGQYPNTGFNQGYNPQNPNQPFNNQYPQPGQPGYNPNNQYPQPGQPGYNPNNQYPQPGQPGYNPNNQYPQPGQPGYNPNNQYPQPGQPGYNPNNQYPQPGQPGYNPNNQYPQPGQPGYNPNNQYPQPGQPGYNPNNQYPQPGQPGYNPNNPNSQYPQPGQPGYNPNNQYPNNQYNPNNQYPQPGQPGYNPNNPNQYGRSYNQQYPNSYNNSIPRYDQFGNPLPQYGQQGYNNQYNQGFPYGGFGSNFRIVKSYNFPTNVATPFGNYMSDLVLDNANGWYAYIADHGDDPGIIIYSFREDRSWKVKDARTMRADPDVGFTSINNIEVELRGKNIHGIALSPAQGYERTVYFSPLGSYNLYSLPTSVLKSSNLNSDVSASVVDLGRKPSISSGMICDNRGNLYFGLLSLNAIGVWNTLQGRFTDHQRIMSRDNRALQWPDSFAIDDQGNLYVVTNRLQNYLTGRVGNDEPNYRILRAQIGARSYQAVADTSQGHHTNQFGGNRYDLDYNRYHYNSAQISTATSIFTLIASLVAFFLAR